MADPLDTATDEELRAALTDAFTGGFAFSTGQGGLVDYEGAGFAAFDGPREHPRIRTLLSGLTHNSVLGQTHGDAIRIDLNNPNGAFEDEVPNREADIVIPTQMYADDSLPTVSSVVREYLRTEGESDPTPDDTVQDGPRSWRETSGGSDSGGSGAGGSALLVVGLIAAGAYLSTK